MTTMKQQESGVDIARGKARKQRRRQRALERNLILLESYKKRVNSGNKSLEKRISQLEKEIETLKSRI